MTEAMIIQNSETDAANLIPPRLGVGAATVGFIDAAGILDLPAVALPRWEPLDDEAVIDEVPMSLEEAASLTELDTFHNPTLARLWRDNVNDDLVDNP